MTRTVANMFVNVALLGLIGATIAADQDAPWGRGCLVSDDGSDQDVVHPHDDKPSDLQSLPTNMTVDVNIHIASTEEDRDLITESIVNAQWDVLQEAFAGHGINLVLNSTERVVDDLTGHSFLIYEGPDKGWVHHEEEEKEYFKSTRKGGYDSLNMYFFSKFSPGATGYCDFPTPIAADDDLSSLTDACRLSAMTMPGFTVEQGGFESWNLGHLAVHEAGHWFGLNHTFAGSCSETGDFVADTPAQRSEVYGCPLQSDTCPDSLGLDPIHNFMGYADDN